MLFDLYTFEYNTKTCKCKHISYAASSFPSALRRFTRNTRHTKLIRIFKNGRNLVRVFKNGHNLVSMIAKA